MAPYRTSIAIKTLKAFGDIWLTDKPKYLKSSQCREFKGNLRLALSTYLYIPTPSTSSPSTKNEDIEVVEPEEGSDDGEEQRIKSVVGTNEIGRAHV